MIENRSFVQLIRKSNDLVEAKYRFDVWETRVFTKTLTLINKDDEDFKNYRIYLNDMVKDFGLENNKESYEWLKRGARGLMQKIITIVREENGIQMEFETPITIGVDKPLDFHREEELRFVDLSFHPKMKPLLLKLKGRFTTYDVRNVLRLPSTYSIRMYELLKQYEKIKQRKIDLTELKEMVGVIERMQTKKGVELIDHYPRFGNFKQRVLLKAKKDLSLYTDISFSFELIKKGRKVDAINFHIFKNNPPTTKKEYKTPPPYPIHSISTEETYQQLQAITSSWPVAPTKELVEKLLVAGYTDVHIRTAAKYTQDMIDTPKGVDNPVAYFRIMVHQASKQGELFSHPAVKKEKSKKRELKAKGIKAQRTKMEDEIMSLSQETRISEEKKIKFLKETQTEIYNEVVKRIQNGRWYNKSMSLEENLMRPSVKAHFHLAMREMFPSEMKDIIIKYKQIDLKKRELLDTR